MSRIVITKENQRCCYDCAKPLEFDSIEQGGFYCNVHNARLCFVCWDNHWIHISDFEDLRDTMLGEMSK